MLTDWILEGPGRKKKTLVLVCDHHLHVNNNNPFVNDIYLQFTNADPEVFSLATQSYLLVLLLFIGST